MSIFHLPIIYKQFKFNYKKMVWGIWGTKSENTTSKEKREELKRIRLARMLDEQPEDKEEKEDNNKKNKKRGLKMRHDESDSSADNYTSDNNSEEDESQQDILANSSEHLPNKVRIQNIIDYMKKFTLMQQIAADLHYQDTEEDKKLEENIKSLFHPTGSRQLWTSEMLTGIFFKIVEKQDILLHPYEKAMYENRGSAHLSSKEKKCLQMFYPNLVRLMMALIAHVHNTKLKTSIMHKEIQPRSVVLGIWKHVLSQLNELLTVIVYVNHEDDDFLGDYPTEWLELVHNRNSDINSLNVGIQNLNDKINELEKIMNERDRELEKVRSKYANKSDEMEIAISKRQNLEEKLMQLLDVKIIVDENIMQLKKFPESDLQAEKAARNADKTSQHFGFMFDD